MKFAIPMAEGRLTMHFGHCEAFAILDVEDGKITNREDAVPPPHEPGVLPCWLAEKKVTNIIAGGMGGRAQALFVQNGIDVITGAPCLAPEEVVEQHVNGTLACGNNACDH